MPDPLPEDVRIVLADGQKIEAIRLLRERTGLGLAEAKAAVEADRLPDATAGPGVATSLPATVSAALAAGDKIQAIKLLRQASGLSLTRAKELVDEASRLRAPQSGGHPGRLAPGEVPRRRWPAAVVALIVVLLAVAVWMLR